MSRTSYLRPGEWQNTLVQLCQRRPCPTDAEVARELSRQHGQHFSKRMVFHHRKQLVEECPGGRLGEDCASLSESQHNARRAYQLRKGLGHLLPDYEQPEAVRVEGAWVTITHPVMGIPITVWWPGQKGGYYGGCELTRRECDVLALLLESDRPLSRREIARSLGVGWQALTRRGKPSVLDRLLARGLIECTQGRVTTLERKSEVTCKTA